MITVHYDYPSKLLTVSYVGLDVSIARLFGGVGPIVTITNNMPVVDETLKKWGIPRL